jgi:hypothetical protein
VPTATDHRYFYWGPENQAFLFSYRLKTLLVIRLTVEIPDQSWRRITRGQRPPLGPAVFMKLTTHYGFQASQGAE